MAVEINAQDVINSLLAQNQQLVAEITFLRISLGLETKQEEKPEGSE